jgi:hypothetical protein
MNIFFLSFDPKKAAQQHADKHVVKMLLESVQLLWTAQHLAYAEHPEVPLPLEPAPTPKGNPTQRGYRPTHRNHPCAKWVRATIANYMWLCRLAAELAEEYHYRYPAAANTEHACEAHVRWLTANPPPLPSGQLTWPALAMPDEYKISQNPTACYRAFYSGSKQARGITTYTRRERPMWLTGK